MNRYKLDPSQQLQRHLLRLSKHHDEASAQLHRKLKQMQENIAPFLPESEHEVGVPPKHMTPCFASRVPTGRLPETMLQSPSRREGRPSERASCSSYNQVVEASGSSWFPVSEVQDPLDASLEAEIDEFLHRGPSASTSRNTAIPVYHTLRRSPAKSIQEPVTAAAFLLNSTPKRQTRAEASTVDPSSTVQSLTFDERSAEACFRPFADNSELKPVSLFSSPSPNRGMPNETDSELGSIEEKAEELETQLAWWKNHREILSPERQCNAEEEIANLEAPTDELQLELTARSEWRDVEDKRNRSCDVDVDDLLRSQSTGLDIISGEGTFADCNSTVEQEPLDCFASLSEIIAKQAAELVTAALTDAKACQARTCKACQAEQTLDIECALHPVVMPEAQSPNPSDDEDHTIVRSRDDGFPKENPDLDKLLSQRAKALALAHQWAQDLAWREVQEA
jgi:hypothetical protein